MFRKIKYKKLLNLICWLVAIFLIIQLYPLFRTFNNSSRDFSDNRSLSDILKQAKTDELNREKRYQVTAIVLHWQRLKQIQRSIKNYVDSKLFQTIIVWNNNPQINLTLNHLLINSTASTTIQIINAKENYKDQGKYRACAKASTRVCFYADDDWDVAHYTRSLIASFRSDPYLLHSSTNDATYYNNLLWSYIDARIGLYAGFSWIGSGSIFLREHAQRHLQLLTVHLLDKPELVILSDVFFAVWRNDIPTQMIVHLRSLPADPQRKDKAFSATEGFDSIHVRSAMHASRTLYSYLLNSNDSSKCLGFPQQRKRRLPYTVRSPSLNDDFIFFSNILPVDIERIPFNITVDADRATYKVVPHGPNYTHFATHSTLKALDNDEKTCWSHLEGVKKGQFFAIDFLRIQDNVAFSITVGHSLKLHSTLDVQISFDGGRWLSDRSIRGTLTNLNSTSITKLQRLVINSSQFLPGFQSFRYIAFNATEAVNEPFQVCEVLLLKNTTKILHK